MADSFAPTDSFVEDSFVAEKPNRNKHSLKGGPKDMPPAGQNPTNEQGFWSSLGSAVTAPFNLAANLDTVTPEQVIEGVGSPIMKAGAGNLKGAAGDLAGAYLGGKMMGGDPSVKVSPAEVGGAVADAARATGLTIKGGVQGGLNNLGQKSVGGAAIGSGVGYLMGGPRGAAAGGAIGGALPLAQGVYRGAIDAFRGTPDLPASLRVTKNARGLSTAGRVIRGQEGGIPNMDTARLRDPGVGVSMEGPPVAPERGPRTPLTAPPSNMPYMGPGRLSTVAPTPNWQRMPPTLEQRMARAETPQAAPVVPRVQLTAPPSSMPDIKPSSLSTVAPEALSLEQRIARAKAQPEPAAVTPTPEATPEVATGPLEGNAKAMEAARALQEEMQQSGSAPPPSQEGLSIPRESYESENRHLKTAAVDALLKKHGISWEDAQKHFSDQDWLNVFAEAKQNAPGFYSGNPAISKGQTLIKGGAPINKLRPKARGGVVAPQNTIPNMEKR